MMTNALRSGTAGDREMSFGFYVRVTEATQRSLLWRRKWLGDMGSADKDFPSSGQNVCRVCLNVEEMVLLTVTGYTEENHGVSVC